MWDHCLTVSAAASQLCLGLVQLSTARAVIYSTGGVTASNVGRGGSCSPAEGARKVFLSWKSQPQTAQGSPGQMWLPSPLAHRPARHPRRAAMPDGCARGHCHLTGRGVNPNGYLCPGKGYCFLL